MTESNSSSSWDPSAWYYCKYCKKTFRQRTLLFEHRQRFHKKEIQRDRDRLEKERLESKSKESVKKFENDHGISNLSFVLKSASSIVELTSERIQTESKNIINPKCQDENYCLTSGETQAANVTEDNFTDLNLQIGENKALSTCSSSSILILDNDNSDVEVLSYQIPFSENIFCQKTTTTQHTIATTTTSTSQTQPSIISSIIDPLTTPAQENTNDLGSKSKRIKPKRKEKKFAYGLRRHSPKHKPKHESTFKCNYCHKLFVSENVLKCHETIHTGEKPFQCYWCPQRFRRRDYRKQHEKVEHKYPCENCSHAFSTSQALFLHRQTEHSSSLPNPLPSSELNEKVPVDTDAPISRYPIRSSQSTPYQSDHQKQEEKTSSVQEKECISRYPIRSNQSTPCQSNHQKQEEKTSSVQEKECISRYPIRSSQSTPYQSNHQKQKEKRSSVQEKECFVTSTPQSQAQLISSTIESPALTQDNTSDLDSKSKQIKPKRKKKKFAYGLRRHSPQHKSKLMCNYCHKLFVSERVLKCHETIHTGEKPFQCNWCPQRFRRTDYRKLHERAEHKYPCKNCSQAFPTSQALFLHRQTKHSSSLSNPLPSSGLSENVSIDTDATISQYLIRSNQSTPYQSKHQKQEEKTSSVQERECLTTSTPQTEAQVISSTIEPPTLTQDNTDFDLKSKQKQPKTKTKIFTNARKKHKSKRLCNYCHKLFSDQSVLKRHQRIHTGEKPFKCNWCPQRFLRPDYRKRHEIVTHKYPYKYFSQRFSTSVKLTVQQTVHSGFSENAPNDQNATISQCPINRSVKRHKSKLRCNYCHKWFVSENALKCHKTIHTGEKPFQCGWCPERFRRRDYRNQHEVVKHRYPCKNCGQAFSNSKKLIAHTQTEHLASLEEEKTSSLQEIKCSVVTSSTTILDSRNDIVTTSIKPNITIIKVGASDSCDSIPKVVEASNYQSKPVIVRSARKTRERKKKKRNKIACKFCGKLFVTADSCHYHEKLHESGYFSCRKCGTDFVRRDHLKRHEALNHKCKCTFCTQSFLTKPKLVDHMVNQHSIEAAQSQSKAEAFSHVKSQRKLLISNSKSDDSEKNQPSSSSRIVKKINNVDVDVDDDDNVSVVEIDSTLTKVPKHSCKYCHKCFAKKSLLNAHERRHTSEKRYKCSYKDCYKAFTKKVLLTQHLRSHTGERPYYCSCCGFSFRYRQNLMRHQKRNRVNRGGSNGFTRLCKNSTDKIIDEKNEKPNPNLSLSFQEISPSIIEPTNVLRTTPNKATAPELTDSTDNSKVYPTVIKQVLKSGILQYNCSECDRIFSYRTDAVKHAASHGWDH